MKRAAPFVAVGLLVVAIAALQLFGSVSVIPEAGVTTTLPDRVGAYTAVDFAYCQDEQCLRAIRVPLGDAPPATCPHCGGSVDAVTLGERTLLPPGTRIVKRSYETPLDIPVHVSIVIAGKERRSIHKPQVCLRGQGFTIRDETAQRVDVGGEEALPVMFLDTVRGRMTDRPLFTSYAYWFVSPTRQTPYHMQRLFWIAFDGAVLGKRHTWAYVAVSATSTRKEHAEQAVKSFLSPLYPHLDSRMAR